MTALVAALALVPLTLAKDAPGKEILYPVATVILGGLLSSTFLDIIVTPVVFWLVGEKALAQYFAAHRPGYLVVSSLGCPMASPLLFKRKSQQQHESCKSVAQFCTRVAGSWCQLCTLLS